MKNGIGAKYFYNLENDRKVEVLAYLFHRRSENGFIDSLSSFCPRDEIFLHNTKAKAKPQKTKGTGDSKLDAFNSFLSKE